MASDRHVSSILHANRICVTWSWYCTCTARVFVLWAVVKWNVMCLGCVFVCFHVFVFGVCCVCVRVCVLCVCGWRFYVYVSVCLRVCTHQVTQILFAWRIQDTWRSEAMLCRRRPSGLRWSHPRHSPVSLALISLLWRWTPLYVCVCCVLCVCVCCMCCLVVCVFASGCSVHMYCVLCVCVWCVCVCDVCVCVSALVCARVEWDVERSERSLSRVSQLCIC